MSFDARTLLLHVSLLALVGCGGSNSSSSTVPATAQAARVRYAEGAPQLETLINGVPASLGNAYLQAGAQTVVSQFTYGSVSPFQNLPPGAHTLTARDSEGYAVGPLHFGALSPGKSYTLIVVGSYPNYQVLTFEEPASNANAQLSLYEASPSVPQAGFGTFRASSQSDFTMRGSAQFGAVVTVALGARVTNLGGYAGSASRRIGEVTAAGIDALDTRNVLPFHNAGRLSLFLFDPKTGSNIGPVVGSLDR